MIELRRGLNARTLGPGGSKKPDQAAAKPLSDNEIVGWANKQARQNNPAAYEKYDRFNDAFTGMKREHNNFIKASLERNQIGTQRKRDSKAITKGIYGPEGRAKALEKTKESFDANRKAIKELQARTDKKGLLDRIVPGRYEKRCARAKKETAEFRKANRTLDARWRESDKQHSKRQKENTQLHREREFKASTAMTHSKSARLGHANEFLGLSKDADVKRMMTPEQKGYLKQAEQWQQQGLERSYGAGVPTRGKEQNNRRLKQSVGVSSGTSFVSQSQTVDRSMGNKPKAGASGSKRGKGTAGGKLG